MSAIRRANGSTRLLAVAIVTFVVLLCACSAPDSGQIGVYYTGNLPACEGSVCIDDSHCAGNETCTGAECRIDKDADDPIRRTCIPIMCPSDNGGIACTNNDDCPPVPPSCGFHFTCDALPTGLACVRHNL